MDEVYKPVTVEVPVQDTWIFFKVGEVLNNREIVVKVVEDEGSTEVTIVPFVKTKYRFFNWLILCWIKLKMKIGFYK